MPAPTTRSPAPAEQRIAFSHNGRVYISVRPSQNDVGRVMIRQLAKLLARQPGGGAVPDSRLQVSDGVSEIELAYIALYFPAPWYLRPLIRLFGPRWHPAARAYATLPALGRLALLSNFTRVVGPGANPT